MKPSSLVIASAFIAGACAIGGAYSRIWMLQERVRELEERKAPEPPRVDLGPIARELAVHEIFIDVCRRRTDDVRIVLETLIAVDRWPGRAKLPTPSSDWGPWPAPGSHVGSVSDPNYFPPPPQL
jgi:hypothetical protein